MPGGQLCKALISPLERGAEIYTVFLFRTHFGVQVRILLIRVAACNKACPVFALLPHKTKLFNLKENMRSLFSGMIDNRVATQHSSYII